MVIHNHNASRNHRSPEIVPVSLRPCSRESWKGEEVGAGVFKSCPPTFVSRLCTACCLLHGRFHLCSGKGVFSFLFFFLFSAWKSCGGDLWAALRANSAASRPRAGGIAPSVQRSDSSPSCHWPRPAGRKNDTECPQPSCLACHCPLPCPEKTGRAIGPSSAAATVPWCSLPFLTPYSLSVPVEWGGLAVIYFFFPTCWHPVC